MSILFKLKCGDEVRRSTFSELPPWGALSSRLSALYGIPPDRLGVSYTDPDGDEITLNTQEELLDYYETCHTGQAGQPLRLKVVDLVSLRGTSTTTPKVVPFAFEADDDWQRLPTLQGLSDIDAFRRSNDLGGPHAFVEIDENVDDGIHTPHGGAAADHHSPASTVRTNLEKGKERELLSFPSTASLIDEEVGDKHPIHVKDCSGQASEAILATEPMEQELKEEDRVEAPREPHPEPTATNDDNDPPLPTIDDSPIPSLTEDIATLLTSLNSAVAMNPDLSRNLRRIVDNATSGRYWRAHRDSLHQAVNSMTESMGVAREELRRNAEAEATTRISNTLGTIFQSLAVAPAEGSSSTQEGDDARAQVLPDFPNLPGAFPSVQGHSRHHHGRRSGGFSGNLATPQSSTDATQPAATPNDDAPHASAPPRGPPRFSGTTTSATANTEPQPSTADRMWDPETRPSWLPAPPMIPTPMSQARQSAQELRAAVEAAKEQYKAEKQRYRRERDERRKQKEEHKRAANATPGAAHSSLPVSREASQETHERISPLARSNSHIVSLARGPYPQLEIINASVPRRSATLGAKREEQDTSRISARITRRLGDMGFTETSHPNLPSQIKARLSENQDRHFTKEFEDNVVTDLLESILATSPQATTPKTPTATGSGARDNHDSVPGGWP